MRTGRRPCVSPSTVVRLSLSNLPAIRPEADRERLVPVRTEGSADEDLLEDATLAIEDYLRARGYRDAMAEHSRTERDGMLTITFTVDRGVRFVVESVAITGNSVVPAADLEKLVQIQSGQPLVQTAVRSRCDRRSRRSTGRAVSRARSSGTASGRRRVVKAVARTAGSCSTSP